MGVLNCVNDIIQVNFLVVLDKVEDFEKLLNLFV